MTKEALDGSFLDVVLVEPAPVVQVDGVEVYVPPSAVEDASTEPQDHDQDDRDVVREEVLGRWLRIHRPDRQVELDDDEQDAENQAVPGSVRVSIAGLN